MTVELGDRSYPVVIGPKAMRSLGETLRAACGAERVALVTDDNVWRDYGERAFSSLLGSGFRVSPITVPAGEGSKCWDRAGDVLERFATAGLGRRDLVLALGGGVVGDLAGFCAAVYMRGVSFAQAPTTLLAQVDSSVGGKTGVDLAAGKNLAGVFWQPVAVVADTSCLDTLAAAEWASGLAEVAKAAILEGGEFFEWMSANAPSLAGRDRSLVPEMVERAVRFKAGVVSADEREAGRRECLNLGHTYGHALERAAGYGAMSHGAAVAEGIRFAGVLAEEVLGAPASSSEAQCALLDALGLAAMRVDAPADEVMRGMRVDKKARDGSVRFVLVSEPGTWKVVPVEADVLKRHVEAYGAQR
ncbi:MAG: 3-dehydroquinate synthase [Actinobacteria bacterium]|nr:MAG: 3-dehydroquinate synthase [Actinomycetota bacterium]